MISRINKIKQNYRCIYFLMIDEKVVYVGKSINAKSRLKQHNSDPFKVFNNFKLKYIKDKSSIDEVEKYWIKYYEPIFNTVHSEQESIVKIIDKKIMINTALSKETDFEAIAIEDEQEKKTETQSNNSWQNIGICYMYAEDKIPQKYQSVFMRIVRQSFGFECRYTNRITASLWSKRIGISKPTFLSHIKYLSENGHIKINTHDGYIDGGGSKPNSYSPVFPRGYGKIWLKNKEEEQDKEEKESSTTERI